MDMQLFSQDYTRTVLVPLFFVVLFVTGLIVYRDYGISWDEPINRYNGEVSAAYINEKLNYALAPKEVTRDLPNLPSYGEKYHGVLFDLFLTAVEVLLKLKFP